MNHLTNGELAFLVLVAIVAALLLWGCGDSNPIAPCHTVHHDAVTTPSVTSIGIVYRITPAYDETVCP